MSSYERGKVAAKKLLVFRRAFQRAMDKGNCRQAAAALVHAHRAQGAATADRISSGKGRKGRGGTATFSALVRMRSKFIRSCLK